MNIDTLQKQMRTERGSGRCIRCTAEELRELEDAEGKHAYLNWMMSPGEVSV